MYKANQNQATYLYKMFLFMTKHVIYMEIYAVAIVSVFELRIYL